MKIIGSPWVKLGCYMVLAALTPFLAFMGDFFGAWKEDRTIVFMVPNWVWWYQGLLGAGNMALVLRSFLDQSFGRHAEEIKEAQEALANEPTVKPPTTDLLKG